MKKFIIIGNGNAVITKEIFPYIKNDQLWMGVSKGISSKGGSMEFKVPNSYEGKYTNFDGEEKYAEIGNVCWFTNISHKKHNTPLELYKKYSPENYPKYDNIDAIDSKTDDIPKDYEGPIAVPISFLDKYCPQQFEILDIVNRYMIYDYFKVNETVRKKHSHCANINGSAKYSRILIRKRNA